jgi:hypothetical protein
VLRKIAGVLLWPVRRFFDPRFQGVVDRVDAARNEGDSRYQALAEHLRALTLVQEQTQHEVNQLHGLIRADMEATSDAVTLLGRSLRDIETALEATRRLVEEGQMNSTAATHELNAS